MLPAAGCGGGTDAHHDLVLVHARAAPDALARERINTAAAGVLQDVAGSERGECLLVEAGPARMTAIRVAADGRQTARSTWRVGASSAELQGAAAAYDPDNRRSPSCRA